MILLKKLFLLSFIYNATFIVFIHNAWNFTFCKQPRVYSILRKTLPLINLLVIFLPIVLTVIQKFPIIYNLIYTIDYIANQFDIRKFDLFSTKFK